MTMAVMGIVGWKNAGKTTTVERLVREITDRGVRVSTVKHAHHQFDIDTPGKDTYRHREAGAHEVVAVTSNRVVIQQELRGGPEPGLDEVLARMNEVDLVIVEGFKRFQHNKIEIHRPSTGANLIAKGDPHIIAIATDETLEDTDLPQLDLNDIPAIADFILSRADIAK